MGSWQVLRHLLEGVRSEEISRIKAGTSRANAGTEEVAPNATQSCNCDPTTVVDQTFGGQLRSTVVCLGCQRVSCSHEPFLDLSLPLPGPGAPMSLATCLSAFTTQEILSGDDAYECEACAKAQYETPAETTAEPSVLELTASSRPADAASRRQRALKVLHVAEAPQVLTLHLKRFCAEGETMRKVDDVVPFGRTIDLDVYPQAPKTLAELSSTSFRKRQRFELYGLVEHFGTHRDGHYVAYTRTAAEPARWHRFSDAKVSEVEDHVVCAAQAFLLFYARVDEPSEQA